MRPGQITAVSAGSLQGVYRPQARIYYRNARYGVLFETLTKPVRCRKRSRAIQLAREWIKTPEFLAEVDAIRGRLAANPENEI